MEPKISVPLLLSYSLSFLKQRGQGYCDDDVERLWANRIFPLIQLVEFSQNWSAIRDDTDIFCNDAGSRYRVQP